MFTPRCLYPLLCLLALTSTPVRPVWAAAPLKLTQGQAKQIASAFLQRMGHPLASSHALSALEPDHLEVMLPPAGTASSSDGSKPARWRMTVPDPIHTQDVEVEDSTGNVVYYRLHDDRPNHQPLETPVSKAQAIAAATAALESAGAFKTKELTLKEAFLDRYSGDGEEWFVSWSRVYHGLPYREQAANVGVNSQTGDVTGFSVNFRTPPPGSSVFNISREQAEHIAVQQMASAGLETTQPPRVQAEVIQPNGFWQPGGSEAERQPCARVAWTYLYIEGVRSYEVWVDAATGTVIGGQVIGRRGRTHPSAPKLPRSR